jgi:hypothetical protein
MVTRGMPCWANKELARRKQAQIRNIWFCHYSTSGNGTAEGDSRPKLFRYNRHEQIAALMWIGTFFLLTAFADPGEHFEARVRPVLVRHCYGCHTKTAMGGLRLDARAAVLAGGKSGAAVVPGKPAESLLIAAVRRTHATLKMPPTGPLPEADVNALVEWVERGAVWPEGAPPASTTAPAGFWAFQPLQRVTPPAVRNAKWARGAVDRFVLAALEAKGLKPVRFADPRTWLRRVTLDLTGLPPTPEEVDAFIDDRSPEAARKVVDRLLASPHYGERWARYWLDLARYSDGQLAAGTDTPLPNAWRYRDWVVEAFNQDLPYDQFVKAQIAAHGLADRNLLPGLGFQALAASAHDQVDTTTKVFLGLTVGCAQCHDHKYDPIPTRDYYSLYGIFSSTASDQHALVEKAAVERYEAQKKKVDAQKELIDEFVTVQQKQLVDTLARHTARYMVAAWKVQQGQTPDKAKLDEETLQRWVEYLKSPDKEHPYLKPWYDLMSKNPSQAQVEKAAADFQVFALALLDEAKEVDDKNYVAFGGKKGAKDERTRQYTNIVSLPVLKFYQWRELANGPYNTDGFRAPAGVYYYSAKELDRWLTGFAKDHLEQLRAELKQLEKELPPLYPFLHSVKDKEQPADSKIHVRGDAKQLGEVAPRRFLSVLSEGEPPRYQQGSGRLPLAEAIAKNPLTARVMVNRIWQRHFGRGLVASVSNFGQMGDRPTHPDLLDWLAQRFADSGWSVKQLHREIVLSATYGLAADHDEANLQADPDNKLLWRANLQPRLDLEALRDSVLAVSGQLDRATGGAATPYTDTNTRRTLYLTVSRTRLDGTMALFDFPDANLSAEQRPTTIGPLQGLFFLNSKFIQEQSRALDQRLRKEAGPDAAARVTRAYRLLYGRAPEQDELAAGLAYATTDAQWPRYLQTLLASAEFTSVN